MAYKFIAILLCSLFFNTFSCENQELLNSEYQYFYECRESGCKKKFEYNDLDNFKRNISWHLKSSHKSDNDIYSLFEKKEGYLYFNGIQVSKNKFKRKREDGIECKYEEVKPI